MGRHRLGYILCFLLSAALMAALATGAWADVSDRAEENGDGGGLVIVFVPGPVPPPGEPDGDTDSTQAPPADDREGSAAPRDEMPGRHTVTYHPGMGEGDSVCIDVEDGDDHVLLHGDDLGYDGVGHSFVRWSLNPGDPSSGYGAGDTLTVHADIDLYAEWSADGAGAGVVVYSVVYDPGGGTGGATFLELAAVNHRVRSAEEAGVHRTGYTFAGWTTSRTALETVYQPDDMLARMPYGGTVTLYALWAEQQGNPSAGTLPLPCQPPPPPSGGTAGRVPPTDVSGEGRLAAPAQYSADADAPLAAPTPPVYDSDPEYAAQEEIPYTGNLSHGMHRPAVGGHIALLATAAYAQKRRM